VNPTGDQSTVLRHDSWLVAGQLARLMAMSAK
jgi:hypothetical protein